MPGKLFTQEELQVLNANPYTLNATPTRIMYTKEAKQMILAMAEQGKSVVRIVRELGYDPEVSSFVCPYGGTVLNWLREKGYPVYMTCYN
ncbi:MAG: hypothetical protein IKH77_00405 [Clostridia bacterium]|nr:hypothetical protein [Clostridia bacterium]